MHVVCTMYMLRDLVDVRPCIHREIKAARLSLMHVLEISAKVYNYHTFQTYAWFYAQ